MKCTIKDYQIIKQAVLEFKPGLTALIGPSNNGKSSIVKAIKAAVYTESGTTPIRHGSDSYIVGIQNDNHTVVYQKKEGSTKYLVDGKSFSRFGVSTPEEVSNALNIKEIVLNGNKIQLNFWDQMDKPFLLDKSSGELFKFIVDSGENDQLSQVLKSMVSDRQQLNKEADVIQGSIKSTENIINERDKYLESHKHTVDLADELITKKIKYDEYKDIKLTVSSYKEKENEYTLLINSLEETDKNIDKYDKLKSIDDKLKSLNEITDSRTRVLDIAFAKTNTDLFIKTYDNALGILDKLKLSELSELIDCCNNYKNIIKETENTLEALRLLRIGTLGDDDKILISLSNEIDINNIKSNLALADEDIIKQTEIISNITNNELELDKIQNLIKVCPYCGQKIGG